ncbi:MAG: 1-deoxy-D-xylulose-5-phosphate reductoisomerase [Gammaproteobacteria bacterium]
MSDTVTSTGITILGATGSIGISTLDVVARHPHRFHVTALTANHNVDRLFAQCQAFRPSYAVMVDESSATHLQQRLRAAGLAIEVLAGPEGLITVAGLPEAHYVMAAIVGAAGLRSTLAAVRSGKRVLLANKEALVMSGAIFMEEVKQSDALLLPIDSEHNALFQCMPPEFAAGTKPPGVRRIILTASGGPFRSTPLERLAAVTPEQACAHPNWNMGPKISVDSATMMNKGLEVIEACWLFDLAPEKVEVVLHPQSVIHSLVEYQDGSMLAQLSNPDMRVPIAHGLAWPERVDSGAKALDLCSTGRLDFEAPDGKRFPCLALAQQAYSAGGTAPAILNAANEVAVQLFLERCIPFTDIPRLIEQTLENCPSHPASSLEAVLADDQQGRQFVQEQVGCTDQVMVP